MNSNNYSHINSPSVRQSFSDCLNNVKDKLEYYVFQDKIGQVNPQVEEIYRIITEVMMLNQSNNIHIGGNDMPVCAVQEIFYELHAENISQVIENFNAMPYQIKNKKAYLRTALYNSFFEIEASVANLYSSTQQRGGDK